MDSLLPDSILIGALKLEPIWSWWRVLGASGLLLTLAIIPYLTAQRHLSQSRRRLLLGLRLASALVLIAAMFRPAVLSEEDKDDSLVLFILADESRSMTTNDGPGGITRRQALLNTFQVSRETLEMLEGKVEIRWYNFAEGLRQVDQLSENAEGDFTQIGVTLRQLLDETREEKSYLGIVLLGDGAQRAVPPNDIDPRTQAELFARQRQIPIYTTTFGGVTIADSTKDLSVEDLLVDPLVFEKKAVPITAKIRINGAAGQKLSVRLLVENRSGVPIGQSGEMQPVEATGNAKSATTVQTTENQAVLPVELSFIPQVAGSYKIALEVVAIDGEMRKENNRLETVISVRKGGLNVAYFDKFRPEQKFIRHVNASDKIQLDYFPVRSGNEFQTKIDPVLFEPGKYDVYIIGDVPATVFGEPIISQLRSRIANDRVGFLMTGGAASFGPGGWGAPGLSLERYLPVKLSPEPAHSNKALKMVPTRQGLRDYVMRLDSPENNRQKWASLAPMAGANLLEKKNEAVAVLAESETDQIPLLFAHEVGGARIMAFGCDTTYQWYLAGQEAEHQQFWQQLILWLAHKEADDDLPVWVTVEPRNFSPDQKVPLRFGARNAEGQPLEGADFTIDILEPDGRHEVIKRANGGGENDLVLPPQKKPGDYWVRVSAVHNNQQPGPDAWTRYVVDARDLEMENPAADPQLMDDIARLTGGSAINAEELGNFLTRKLQDIEELRYERLSPLWDNWFFLLLFVLLVSVEWFFRKRFGLI